MGVPAVSPQPLASNPSYSEKIVTAYKRSLSTTASFDSADGEFSGKSAYAVLGVSESSSFAEIKASFRKLAKETHPDVSGDLTASKRFLQILAAYEILSDSNKRAHYDYHLFSQRKIMQKHDKSASVMYMHSSSLAIAKEGEVVEWLIWYRLVIDDIVTERRVAVGSGYFDKLECELYAAIRAAYFGPLIESMDFLPDRFEAEERSSYETSEVLHLVSGRDLFGILHLVDKVPQLSDIHCEKVMSFKSMSSKICQYDRQIKTDVTTSLESPNFIETQDRKDTLDVYKDLELHIYGQLVATATRNPPKSQSSSTLAVDHEDQINVFLSLDGEVYGNEAVSPGNLSSPVRSRILLGTISGLGTEAEEGTCSVYDGNDTKTHVIVKHRTLMVKHMHWYQVGDEVSACECRCSRARLPTSKFWLFEPRSSMHDIGGWYVETFGRDKKGRTMPSQRQWDSMVEHHEKRLHPAMYLVALAYRTLDLEDAKRRKQTLGDFYKPKLYGALRWCKRLL